MEKNKVKKLSQERNEDANDTLKNKNVGKDARSETGANAGKTAKMAEGMATGKAESKNVFEKLQNLFIEEGENNKRKYEDLSEHIDKMKTYFDEKINSLKDNTHENLEELKYYLDQLNKNNKGNITESNTFKDDFDLVKIDMIKLKKQKEDNVNLIKSSMRTYFDKIKSVRMHVDLCMLSATNANIESIREELTNYKENNQIENKKRNIEILQLINDECEILNKKIEESLNSLSTDVREARENMCRFKEYMENQMTEIKCSMEANKKEMDDKINAIYTNQKKLMEDFYPSEKS
ncbi:conserved Plasmodium protein, unknown function [Plasmodium ovale curtisi]|uniref:Uncharacterized protein n=1 Tax=Plasmodium ovale curtisi TaxID=864141 RepID=A0A1A8X032_PLAOA|nr:conserved Plasmodium protein, unknown function [Plasmodium ovale curtisi]SBS97029.1 conserved Plasmodium protein, unknown function [Plasmodium ovale curtisi]